MTRETPFEPHADVELERHGKVALIALNRPACRNALDIATRTLLAEIVQRVVEDDTVGAIVLTGRGGHFCAGGDVRSMQAAGAMSAEAGRRRMRDMLRTIEQMYTCEKPVVAAVEGSAYGGGFGIALLADIVIASESARFCMSFANVGLVPDGASLYTLPRVVGVQRAKELMLSGRVLDAHDAKAYGIVMEVVQEGTALDRSLRIAGVLAESSLVATALTKTALNNSLSSDLRSMVAFEAAAQGIAFSTDFHRDAIGRFLDKRPPAFKWPDQAD